MNAFEWVVTGVLAALVIWGLLKIPHRSSYKEHETPRDRQEADEQITSIRGSLRPDVDGETIVRSTDFGALQEESNSRPHVRAGTWSIK